MIHQDRFQLLYNDLIALLLLLGSLAVGVAVVAIRNSDKARPDPRCCLKRQIWMQVVVRGTIDRITNDVVTWSPSSI
jgi:hypothetical protein